MRAAPPAGSGRTTAKEAGATTSGAAVMSAASAPTTAERAASSLRAAEATTAARRATGARAARGAASGRTAKLADILKSGSVCPLVRYTYGYVTIHTVTGGIPV